MVKPGVSIVGVSPELAFGWTIIAAAYGAHGWVCVATAVTDGKHGNGSLHYVGSAIDLRLPSRQTGDPADDLRMVSELRIALGEEWDCVLEETHLHLEHDVRVKAPKEVPA
jgi:hypothetical protein